MEYRNLGKSDLKVSALSLGTMTFGEQCSKEEAFKILDFSIDAGINLIDTAEMYPVYPRPTTYGVSEEILGEYFSKRSRKSVFLATKIASCNPIGIGASKLSWIRSGGENLRFDRENINSALVASLKRLKTDYIDLYQLHWPERRVPMSDCLDYDLNSSDSYWTDFGDVLVYLNDLVKKGLIRYIGLSNETAWGLCKYLSTSTQLNLLGPICIQSAYNLINRVFDIAHSEVALMEKVGVLAYSPLAGGRLTGKYLNDARPDGARYTMWPGPNTRYHSDRVSHAVYHYAKLADKYSLSLSEMSYAFVLSRPYISSVIIGCSNLMQVKNAFSSLNTNLVPELLEELDNFHRAYPNPAV
jgi:aryl-alcohol dehydrogenase-like predicted oxidoreductase